MEKYPDYGKKWMYFPDGNELPQIVFLPAQTSQADYKYNKDDISKLVNFRLYTRSV